MVISLNNVFSPLRRNESQLKSKRCRRLFMKRQWPSSAKVVVVVSRLSSSSTSTSSPAPFIPRRTLLLVAAYDRNIFLAGRNIPGLTILKSSQVNAYEVMRVEYLLITRSGLGALEEVFGRS